MIYDKKSVISIFFIILSILSRVGNADFVDIAHYYGLDVPAYAGITVYDFDQDGDEDILLGRQYDIPCLFEWHNHKFTQIGTRIGLLPGCGNGQTYASGTWGDFDADGDQDLYVTSGNTSGGTRLYVQYIDALPAGQYTLDSTSTAIYGPSLNITKALIAGTDSLGKTFLVVDDVEASPHPVLTGLEGPVYSLLVDLQTGTYYSVPTGSYFLSVDSVSHGVGRATLDPATNMICMGSGRIPDVSSGVPLVSEKSYVLSLSGTAYSATSIEIDNVLVAGLKSGKPEFLSINKSSAETISGFDSPLYGVIVDVGSPIDNTGSLELEVTNVADASDTLTIQFNPTINAINISELAQSRQIPIRRFVDEATERGVYAWGASSNSAWIDFDQDGDLDLWVGRNQGPDNSLFENDGTGHFSDRAANDPAYDLGDWGDYSKWIDMDVDGDPDLITHSSIGVVIYENTGTGFSPTTGFPGGWPNVGDFDLDGDFDMVITRGYTGGQPPFPNHLYLNTAGSFLESPTAGLDTSGLVNSLTFDYDNDGDMDIFARDPAVKGRLYQNDGMAHFIDVGIAENLNPGPPADEPRQIAYLDFDYDGDLDLFLINGMSNPCSLLRNDLSVSKSTQKTILTTDISGSLKVLVTDSEGHWNRHGSTVQITDETIHKLHATFSIGLNGVASSQCNYLATAGIPKDAFISLSVYFTTIDESGPIIVGPNQNILLEGFTPASVGFYLEIQEDGTVIDGFGNSFSATSTTSVPDWHYYR